MHRVDLILLKAVDLQSLDELLHVELPIHVPEVHIEGLLLLT